MGWEETRGMGALASCIVGAMEAPPPPTGGFGG